MSSADKTAELLQLPYEMLSSHGLLFQPTFMITFFLNFVNLWSDWHWVCRHQWWLKCYGIFV